MVPPGLSSPEASAASTMRRAMRSFTDPPGFMYSTFARTVQATPASLTTLLSLTRGVFPTRSAMCSAYFTRAILSDGGHPVCRAAGARPGSPDRGVRAPAVTSGRYRGGTSSPEGHTHGEGGTRTSDRRHAAYGGGGVAAGIGALGAIGYGVLKAEARIARRIVGVHFEGAPDDNGLYGAGPGEPVELVMLGDSSAAGMGADNRYQTVGAIIATGVSALTGRPVRLTNTAVIGAESSGLERQLALALEQVERPHVAVIMIGANDITHRINKAIAVRHLESTVQRLREVGAQVVVATCPDLGTIGPIPQPLRLVGRRWSRDLAAAQTVAVVEAGGRTVSLGDLLGPEFAERPHELFSKDRFHPSPAGYARCAAALLPSVYAALGVWEGAPQEDRLPDRRRGEGIGPVALAAEQAVRDPGTEVSATEIAGQPRGPAGAGPSCSAGRATRYPRGGPPSPAGSRPPVRREAGTAAGEPTGPRAGSPSARRWTTSPWTARPRPHRNPALNRIRSSVTKRPLIASALDEEEHP